jgi:hypothetical protein
MAHVQFCKIFRKWRDFYNPYCSFPWEAYYILDCN